MSLLNVCVYTSHVGILFEHLSELRTWFFASKKTVETFKNCLP